MDNEDGSGIPKKMLSNVNQIKLPSDILTNLFTFACQYFADYLVCKQICIETNMIAQFRHDVKSGESLIYLNNDSKFNDPVLTDLIDLSKTFHQDGLQTIILHKHEIKFSSYFNKIFTEFYKVVIILSPEKTDLNTAPLTYSNYWVSFKKIEKRIRNDAKLQFSRHFFKIYEIEQSYMSLVGLKYDACIVFEVYSNPGLSIKKEESAFWYLQFLKYKTAYIF